MIKSSLSQASSPAASPASSYTRNRPSPSIALPFPIIEEAERRIVQSRISRSTHSCVRRCGGSALLDEGLCPSPSPSCSSPSPVPAPSPGPGVGVVPPPAALPRTRVGTLSNANSNPNPIRASREDLFDLRREVYRRLREVDMDPSSSFHHLKSLLPFASSFVATNSSSFPVRVPLQTAMCAATWTSWWGRER